MLLHAIERRRRLNGKKQRVVAVVAGGIHAAAGAAGAALGVDEAGNCAKCDDSQKHTATHEHLRMFVEGSAVGETDNVSPRKYRMNAGTTSQANEHDVTDLFEIPESAAAPRCGRAGQSLLLAQHAYAPACGHRTTRATISVGTVTTIANMVPARGCRSGSRLLVGRSSGQ